MATADAPDRRAPPKPPVVCGSARSSAASRQSPAAIARADRCPPPALLRGAAPSHSMRVRKTPVRYCPWTESNNTRRRSPSLLAGQSRAWSPLRSHARETTAARRSESVRESPRFSWELLFHFDLASGNHYTPQFLFHFPFAPQAQQTRQGGSISGNQMECFLRQTEHSGA